MPVLRINRKPTAVIVLQRIADRVGRGVRVAGRYRDADHSPDARRSRRPSWQSRQHDGRPDIELVDVLTLIVITCVLNCHRCWSRGR